MKKMKINHFICFLLLECISAWYVTPPRMGSDWESMAKLIVDAFEAPAENASTMENARWFLYEKEVSERATYRQYVDTAKKMKGSKYNVLVAKEFGHVMGMIELGITGSDEEKRPTIGLICVSKEFQHRGVGADLVEQSQKLVTDVWKDDTLCAEVAESNAQAISFFKSLGFVIQGDKRVMVNLRRGLRMEKKPHILLSKELERVASSPIGGEASTGESAIE